jgi:rubrerythrin
MEHTVREPGESPGAVEELRRDDASRKRFLKMVGGAGAAGALSILMAACGSDDKKKKSSGGGSSSSDTKGDLAIVNYALTLEYLEAEFYKEVLASGKVTDKKLAEVAKTIAADENAHVEALTATVKTLGGKPAAKPATAFEPVIAKGAKTILETAATVENLGAAAYLGQAANIKSKEVLAAALSIHTVEARHAAVLNAALGKTIVPDGAFAKPASMSEVLKAVKPFIKA